MPSEKEIQPRYRLLDALRGAAVLLMIVFHAAYDIDYFGLARIEMFENPFWYGLPRLTVSLFLICVGMSLSLVHKNGIQWRKVRKRLIRIGGWAALITVVTYILFPKNFVFFGILHFITVASVVGVFWVNRPKVSLCVGAGLLLSDRAFQPTLLPLSAWLGVNPMDYVPFYPWFGVVLIGIYLESVQVHRMPLRDAGAIRLLELMGRHALLIYLIHRPVLFGSFFFVHQLKTI